MQLQPYTCKICNTCFEFGWMILVFGSELFCEAFVHLHQCRFSSSILPQGQLRASLLNGGYARYAGSISFMLLCILTINLVDFYLFMNL